MSAVARRLGSWEARRLNNLSETDFGGGKGAGEGGVNITHYYHKIGFFLEKEFFVCHHDTACLFSMGSTANA